MPDSRKPWYASLTIDVLAHVVNRSLLHPFIAWLIPLCLRAIGASYHATDFILACIWASLVTLFAVLAVVNRRVAYGVPREIDWAEEVVVLVGGAGGLGGVLAEMYKMRGANVAILDVRNPVSESGTQISSTKEPDADEEVRFYHCDITDAETVERVRAQIEIDLGPPTILVNAAAIVHGRPFLDLSPKEISTSLNVNLLGPMNTIRVFLPHMLRSAAEGTIPGATLVTVSSVLGKLGARNLVDYTAAKAGLIAMHRSLVAELTAGSPSRLEGADCVRCVLVTPGQLATGLFAGVQTPSTFFGPVVESVELARELVKVIDAGVGGEVSLPLYARWIEWMDVLPVGVQRVVRWMSGIDRAMEGFVGVPDEQKKAKEQDEVKALRKTK